MNNTEFMRAVDRCDDRLYETFARNAELAEERKKETLESIFSDPSEFMEKFHYLTWKFDLSDMDLFITTALKMAYQRDYSSNATENLIYRLKQLEPVVDNSVDVLVEKELNLLPY